MSRCIVVGKSSNSYLAIIISCPIAIVVFGASALLLRYRASKCIMVFISGEVKYPTPVYDGGIGYGRVVSATDWGRWCCIPQTIQQNNNIIELTSDTAALKLQYIGTGTLALTHTSVLLGSVFGFRVGLRLWFNTGLCLQCVLCSPLRCR